MTLSYHEDLRDWSLSDYLNKIEKKNLVYKVWKTGEVWDQGSFNDCVGHACAMLIESEPKATKSPEPDVIFNLARTFDTVQKTGTGIRSGLKALQKLGYVKSYYWTTEITEILVAVLNLGPVLVGIDFYAGMHKTTDRLYASGGVIGNHALVIYGVDLEKQDFLVVNSYGPDWGTLGKAKVSFATMAKIFKYGFAIEKS